jgi:O-glycosyl hydrolase
MNLERTHCFLQVIKILEYKGLTYTDLYNKRTDKKEMYYENTSVLSYYILNAVILNDFENFFMWCIKNNKNILQFDNTEKKQIEFCKFIENNYKTKLLLDRINCISGLLLEFKNNNTSSSIQELLQNMRKSLCELE